MTEAQTFRVRHPEGTCSIQLTEASKIIELKLQIAQHIKMKPENMALRVGYPPTLVSASDNELVSELNITSGDLIIVEFEESKENMENSAITAKVTTYLHSNQLDTSSQHKYSETNSQPGPNNPLNTAFSQIASQISTFIFILILYCMQRAFQW